MSADDKNLPRDGAPVMEVQNLDVRYGAAKALFDVSFTLPAGSMLAVVGPNGAGKSSIARAVSGLVPITSGTVKLDGVDITNRRPELARRAGIVHLPEGRGVFPTLTVQENLRMAALTLPRAERPAAIARGYEIFTPLSTRRRQQAGTMSGGEQQMLSLARALVVSPKVVVADEMSLGLAPKMVDLVFENLKRLQETGVSVIVIEQYVHRALSVADHALMMLRGTAAWFGPTADAKDEVLRRYLGEGAA